MNLSKSISFSFVMYVCYFQFKYSGLKRLAAQLTNHSSHFVVNLSRPVTEKRSRSVKIQAKNVVGGWMDEDRERRTISGCQIFSIEASLLLSALFLTEPYY